MQLIPTYTLFQKIIQNYVAALVGITVICKSGWAE